jgi:ribosomal protein S18 acetylase RimI-like enzyme
VVGFCLGTTIEKPRSSWKYGYLVWLGCSVNYQGLGLASQLYTVMTALFAKARCRIVMIDTQQNNRAALAFFRNKGFGHDEEHVYLSNATLPTAAAAAAEATSTPNK